MHRMLQQVKETTVAGNTLIELRLDARSSLHILPVLDCQQWQAKEYEARSPLGLASTMGKMAPWPSKGVVLFVAKGTKPKPLLEYCAEHAFHDLGIGPCKRLAKDELKIDDIPESLPALLCKIVMKAKDCSLSVAATILQQRCLAASVVDEELALLKTSEFQESIDKDAASETNSWLEQMDTEKGESGKLLEHLIKIKSSKPHPKRKPIKMPGSGTTSCAVA